MLTPILAKSFLPLTFGNLIQEIRALFNRLVIQSYRRFSFLLAGLIQPLLWLILFGSLFQNFIFPAFSNKIVYYDNFLSPGVIVFTAFTSSLNAGLPIMFDREFGFFNRLLAVPMTSRLSIVVASFCHIVCVTTVQMLTIWFITMTKDKIYISINFSIIFYNTLMLLLLICFVTVLSIVLAFVLSGHIELLALILIINLPILFSSTALAPLTFMPKWLQLVATLNPLTYPIEALRYTLMSDEFCVSQKTIVTMFGQLSVIDIIFSFFLLNFLMFFAANYFFHTKLE